MAKKKAKRKASKRKTTKKKAKRKASKRKTTKKKAAKRKKPKVVKRGKNVCEFC